MCSHRPCPKVHNLPTLCLSERSSGTGVLPRYRRRISQQPDGIRRGALLVEPLPSANAMPPLGSVWLVSRSLLAKTEFTRKIRGFAEVISQTSMVFEGQFGVKFLQPGKFRTPCKSAGVVSVAFFPQLPTTFFLKGNMATGPSAETFRAGRRIPRR